MCECGCTGNADRYKFPAPNGAFYLLSLYPHCTNCDVPSGFTIELIEPGTHQFQYWTEDFPDGINGELPFENWERTESKGVSIVCGLRVEEFIEKLKSHLIGVDSNELGDDGVIDEDGADVIVEEMYEDAQVQPALVKDDSADTTQPKEN